jgi:hypothetical protein
MKLIEIKNTDLRRKWINKFLRAYHGKQVDVFACRVRPNDTYLVGYANHRDIGYVSLRELDGAFAIASPNGKVLKCAFVEENRRGRGALKQMIQLATEHYDVEVIEIERDRFERNRAYYAELGFTQFECKSGETLGYCYSEAFAIALLRARLIGRSLAANDNAKRMVALPYAA